MYARCWPLMAMLIIILVSIPRTSWCYEEDVHFSLTFVLCQSAGFSLDEAIYIAAADQSVDENTTTTAWGWPFPKDHTKNGRQWHAFSGLSDADKARKAVDTRLTELWNDAGKAISAPTSPKDAHDRAQGISEKQCVELVRFGQYLHFFQDTFSHRQIGKHDLELQAYVPYGDILGHFLEGHNPDRIPVRVSLAKMMAEQCYLQMREFTTKTLHRTKADTPFKPGFVEIPKDVSDAIIDTMSATYIKHTVVTDSDAGTHITDYWEKPNLQKLSEAVMKTLSEQANYVNGRPTRHVEALCLPWDPLLRMKFDEHGQILNSMEFRQNLIKYQLK